MIADLLHRLGELGAVLAQKMPGIVDAALVLLESISPALDAVGFGRYEIQRQIGLGGHAEVIARGGRLGASPCLPRREALRGAQDEKTLRTALASAR